VKLALYCAPCLALVALGCDPTVVVGHAASDAAVTEEPPPPVSWPSGAHTGNELQTYVDFGDWRGRTLDVAQGYTDRRSWQGLVEPGWFFDALDGFEGTIALSQPFFPEGTQGSTADCAAGAYDVGWQKLGTFLVERGRADTILRLGWGFNDPTKEWRVGTDPSEWIACFRRIVDLVRAGDPDVRIEWTLNSYASAIPGSGDPFDAYPGDDYVDIVGTDVYDMNPPVHDQAEWDARCAEPWGICSVMEFARAHGKRAASGEWGVASCGTDPGGDNAFFVRKMFDTFAANDDILAYEAYFNDPAAGVCSQIWGGDQNPDSAARYRELYGPR
jgi:hypothetical protein